MQSKIILLLIAVFVSLNATAMQPKTKSGPDLTAIIGQLQLDAEQAARLTALVKQQHSDRQASRQQRQQQRQAAQEKRRQHRAALLTVLNHEQLYRFEQHMQQMRQQRHKQGSAQD